MGATARRYLTCAETAKLVRKALKEAYPYVPTAGEYLNTLVRRELEAA